MRTLIVVLLASLAAAISAQEPPWPQFRANPQLSGVAASPLAPALKVMWTFPWQYRRQACPRSG